MNKKILIAIIIIVAISAIGAVAYNMLLANDGKPRGSIVFQSDVTGVTVILLCPDETVKTGVVGSNGMLTFSELPNGDYPGVAAKDGYFSSQLIGVSVKNDGSTTIPISLMAIPSEQSLITSTNPDAVIIKRGSSGAVSVAITSQRDYAGAVSIEWNQLPVGVTAIFSPATSTIAPGGNAVITSNFSVSSSAAKGIYPLDIELSFENGEIGGFGLLLMVS